MDFDALEEAEELEDEKSDGPGEMAFLRAVGVKSFQDLQSKEMLALQNVKISGPFCLQKLSHLRHFTVKRCELQQLSSSLGQLQQLQTLDLSENHLESLPEKLVKLQSLIELNLANNRLVALPDHLSQLENLRKLNVRKNLLTSLPSFFGFSALVELDASANSLECLPDDLGCCSNLTTLWLGGNQVTELPDLGTTLVGLQLAQNLLQVLPESMGKLHQLQHLDVSHNCLMTLPKVMDQLTELCTLDVTGNRLSSMTCHLPRLRKLWASDNMIERLPETFDEFLMLQTLELVGNPILTKMQLNRQHPVWLQLSLLIVVGSLRQCHLGDSRQDFPILVDDGHLCLQGHDLRSLPQSLYLLHSMKSIDANDNRIVKLSEKLGKLQNLEKLCISNNQLSELPTSFCQLTHLQVLDASCNRLQWLPDDLGNLGQSLLELRLSQNILRKLPESFCSLTQLLRADFTQNRLVTLPRSFGKLSKLEWLGLGHNELVDLPMSFRKLTGLTALYLAGTPLASTLLQVDEDLPEQRILWEMNQWGVLAVIKTHAQQQGQVPETLVKWRWAPMPESFPAPRVPDEPSPSQEAMQLKVSVARDGEGSDVEVMVERIRGQLDAVTDARSLQQLMRHLFREWHPDKRLEDEKVLATRVFQWLQEVKVHYLQ